MSVQAEFQIDGVKKFLNDLAKKFGYISKRDRNYAKVIAPIIYKDVIEHFEQERGEKSSWQAWSPSYIDFMVRIGKSGNKILQDSGRLRNNFKPSDWKKSSDGLTWFNDAQTRGGFPYAFAHNEGGPQLPKRDFMWLSQHAMHRVADRTIEFLIKEGITVGEVF